MLTSRARKEPASNRFLTGAVRQLLFSFRHHCDRVIAWLDRRRSRKTPTHRQTICRNKRAFHDYEIFDTLECGIVLTGTEVKSLREHAASLEEAYAKIEHGELWLIGSDIPEYTMGNRLNHKPKRPRKLLLHKRELDKFAGKASQQGYTLMPLRLYFKQGRAKVEIAVARGKKLYDKREDIKMKDDKREVERTFRSRYK